MQSPHLWCLATLLSVLTTVAAVESAPVSAPPFVIAGAGNNPQRAELATPVDHPSITLLAGPWILAGEDGVLRVGVEVAGSPAMVPVTVTRGGRTVAAKVDLRPLRRPRQPVSTVVGFALPTGSGPCHFTFADRTLSLTPSDLPSSDTPARVVVVGGWNYPDRNDLVRLEPALGGPVQLVVGVGRGVLERLGSGGWEESLPVICLGADEAEDAFRQGILGEAALHWRHGAHWGLLGLPSTADDADAGMAVARDLSRWQAYVSPHGAWDLGLGAPLAAKAPANAVPLLAICQHLRVPLILAAGSRVGWVSEPLVANQGKPVIRRGGTRYVAAIPGGEGMAWLPNEVASAIEQPAFIGLAAGPEELVMTAHALGGTELLRLRWSRAAITGGPAGSGFGLDDDGNADPERLRATWLASDDAGLAARRRLAWFNGADLALFHLADEELPKLVALASAEPVALRLLRRLAGIDPVVLRAAELHLDTQPPTIIRDAALRHLTGIRPIDDDAWIAFVSRTQDTAVLRAVLHAHDVSDDQDLLRVILARIRLQAAGTVPVESDPMLEHHLLSAAFDATSISPTTLRPLALALRSRLDPLARGPVERFIARHGEVRQ